MWAYKFVKWVPYKIHKFRSIFITKSRDVRETKFHPPFSYTLLSLHILYCSREKSPKVPQVQMYPFVTNGLIKILDFLKIQKSNLRFFNVFIIKQAHFPQKPRKQANFRGSLQKWPSEIEWSANFFALRSDKTIPDRGQLSLSLNNFLVIEPHLTVA